MINKRYKSWGKSIALNLFECDIALLSNPEKIKLFFTKLIPTIDMVAHGSIYIDRFGLGELEGYSAMQFIETSSITVHCDEPDKRVFIDVFSCKDFDSQKIIDFSKTYWKAKQVTSTTLIR